MKQRKEPTQQSDSYNHMIRRVVKAGNLTLTVSLPRAHCREMGIDAGAFVKVVRLKNGFLITRIITK